MNQYSFSWAWVSERLDVALRLGPGSDPAKRAAPIRTFLSFFAPPRYVLYNPGEWLLANSKAFLKEHRELFVDPVSDCVGAPDRVLALLGVLADAFGLEEDAALVFEVCEDEERGEKIPRIGIGLAGPGHFNERVFLGDCFRMSFEETCACWTLATRDGRVDLTENGMDLRLRGMRLAPEPLPEVQAFIEILDTMPPEVALRTLRERITEARPPEPTDIRTATEKALADRTETLREASIQVIQKIPANLSPILVDRREWQMMILHLVEWAVWVLPPAGSIILSADYNIEDREMAFHIALKTKHGAIRNTVHREAMLHAVAAMAGRAIWTPGIQEDKETACAIFLPDHVGRALDNWMPGWEAFSEGNRRMLRLLKSGSVQLPEGFVLNGVLESELERLLWARLQSPAARNVANERIDHAGHAPGGDAARRKKALIQIARGKPKKELCAPAYAAELLWAFREDERGRAVLGLARSSLATIERFCAGLTANPPDQAALLRLLAEMIRENS